MQGHRSNSIYRRLEKGTWTDYEVIMTAELKFKGSGGFRDCGAWDRNYLWSQRRVYFTLFSVAIVMHSGVEEGDAGGASP